MNTHELKALIVAPDGFLREAIEAIDASKRLIALFLETDELLIATVTDSNVRCGIGRNAGLEAARSEFDNMFRG